MVGIQVSALERIEHGHARPSIALLDALARELDSSLVDLMKQARAKPPKLVDARAILDRLGMHVCAGNQSAAARLLGLERKALVRRVEKTRGRR